MSYSRVEPQKDNEGKPFDGEKDRKILKIWWRGASEIENLTRADLMPANESHDCAPLFEDRGKTSNVHSWYGHPDGIKGVKELAQKGWPEGMEKANKVLRDLVKVPEDLDPLSRKRIRGPIGDHLDMQRLYKGQFLKAWESRKRLTSSGDGVNFGVTRIMVQLCANAGYDNDDLFWRGAAACVLADTLELMGRSVEIVGYSHSRNMYSENAKDRIDYVPLKEAGDPLDLENLIVVTALSGWFRYYLFKAYLCREDRRAHGGLGQAVDYPHFDDLQQGDIVIGKVYGEQASKDFIKEQIRVFRSEDSLVA